ncbi:type IV pilus modification PilV family protein [Eubacterium aggregans]|uniref:type IV pilus modification PilV family protein n=1 Tax=Eubacterium aggregans TaxID=81409 RepID=UPI0023F28B23|nr:hypothetical protein [Eubacterium aggregans]MDD4692477.1 hypothetical protein [Eubacterium aggregans]
MFKENKGSALIWVIVICIIFALMVVTMMTLAASMNKRSIQNNQNQQAYFTARSAVDVVAAQFNGDATTAGPDIRNALFGTDSLKAEDLETILKQNHTTTIASLQFNEMMGTVENINLDYNSKTQQIAIKATAKVNNEERTVYGDLGMETVEKGGGTVVTLPEWPSEEGATSLLGTKQGNSDKILEEIGDTEKDMVYTLSKSNQTGATQNLEAISGSKDIFIFVEDNVTLNIQGRTGTTGPDIYIILKGANSKVVFQSPQSTTLNGLFIYGMTDENNKHMGSVLVAKTNGSVTIKGYAYVGTIGSGVTIDTTRKPQKPEYQLTEEGYTSKTEDGKITYYIWNFIQYRDR